MMKSYPNPDAYFSEQTKWSRELCRLREILLTTGLDEALKWSMPNYLHGKKLVVGICGFKEHFGIWFHQGALLTDPAGVLKNAQQGKTRAMRQWRMDNFRDIKARTIKTYIKEAVGLLDEGIELSPRRQKPIVVPMELQQALASNTDLRQQFDALSKTRRREFAEHVGEAKRAETRLRRLEKILPMIQDGVGLNDKYRR